MDNTRKIQRLTRTLLDFDTENFDDRASGYTLELLEFVKAFLSRSGINSRIHSYDLERRIDGKNIKLGKRGILLSEFDPNKPIILLQGHADTVPIAQRYGKRIANVQKEKGIIRGRGAVDMKSSLAAFILALEKLKKYDGLPYQPVLLITSDEEAGEFAGMKKFLEIYKKSGMDIKFAICGEATDFAIKHNLLGAMYVRFHFSGKSGHAANKRNGENAIDKAAIFLGELLAFQKKLENEKSDLGKAVLNIGIIRGGEKVNFVPASCDIEISLRSTRENDYYEKGLARLAKQSGGRMETVFSYNPTVLSPNNNFLLQLRASAHKYKKRRLKNIMKEFTEATLLNNCGIETIVFGPGDPLLNHADDEHINIRDVSIYKEVIKDLFKSLP